MNLPADTDGLKRALGLYFRPVLWQSYWHGFIPSPGLSTFLGANHVRDGPLEMIELRAYSACGHTSDMPMTSSIRILGTPPIVPGHETLMGARATLMRNAPLGVRDLRWSRGRKVVR